MENPSVDVPRYHSASGTFKLLALTARRRPRRTIILLLSLACVVLLLLGLDSQGYEAAAPLQAVTGEVSPGRAPNFGGRPGTKLFTYLSLRYFWTTPAQRRRQILEDDQPYLDHQQRSLPRLPHPSPDIDRWSRTRREKTLEGLEWLIFHYNQRWPINDGIEYARSFNQDTFIHLRDCIEQSLSTRREEKRWKECSPESMTVIILGSHHFGRAQAGQVGGEQIWARSVIDTFDDLGYSTIYAYGMVEQYDIYRAIPDLVRLIIVDADHTRACQIYGRPEWSHVLSDTEIENGALVQQVEARAKDEEKTRYYSLAEWHKLANHNSSDHWATTIFYGHPLYRDQPSRSAGDNSDLQPQQEWRCAQTPDFPQGIPLWKLFAFHYWDGSNDHPLGGLWTLAPEPYSTFPKLADRKEHNFYAGYSIEAYCEKPVPWTKRLDRAYVLAKQPSYFDPPDYGFSDHVFEDIKEQTGIEFVAGTGNAGSELSDRGITNFGVMNATTFRDVLGHSKALVGIGRPILSPTPYDAMCMGVPFINSITNWNKQDPEDQSQWSSQHDALFDIGEPYVYRVKQGDQDGLKSALEKAAANPIERFIPLRMTRRALQARYRSLVETDWEAVFLNKFPDMEI